MKIPNFTKKYFRIDNFLSIISKPDFSFDHDGSLNLFLPQNSLSHIEFAKAFSTRSLINDEYWLFDISKWNSLQDAMEDLKILKLRLNDRFFLFQNTEGGVINIWECYGGIGKERRNKALFYGNWTISNGLWKTSVPRWERRKDLEVRL